MPRTGAFHQVFTQESR